MISTEYHSLVASFPGLPRFFFVVVVVVLRFAFSIIHMYNTNRRTKNGVGLGARLTVLSE